LPLLFFVAAERLLELLLVADADFRAVEDLEAVFRGAAFLVERLAAFVPFEADLPVDLVARLVAPFLEAPLEALFFEGTFSPFSLASESPMAMACLREVTFLPLPLRSSPCFISCITSSTFLPAPLEYLAIVEILG
jgi:hypothetical protein